MKNLQWNMYSVEKVKFYKVIDFIVSMDLISTNRNNESASINRKKNRRRDASVVLLLHRQRTATPVWKL